MRVEPPIILCVYLASVASPASTYFHSRKTAGEGWRDGSEKKIWEKKGDFFSPPPSPPDYTCDAGYILHDSQWKSILINSSVSVTIATFFFFFLISSLHDRTQKQTIRVCFISALLQSQLFLQSVDEVVISKTLSMLQCFKKPDL